LTTNELSLRSNNDRPEMFRVKGDDVTILTSLWDAQTTTPTPVTLHRSDLEADNTIDGLFARTDEALRDAAQRTSIDSQTVYEIHIDPTLGYVTYYDTECQERLTPQVGEPLYNCPTDTYVRVRVSNFKVLSRVGPVTERPALATPTSAPANTP
jgi:hypothetical protein